MFSVVPKPGIRFQLFDHEYLILKNLPDQKIEAEEDRFKTIKIFTHSELIKHLSNGNLKFECSGRNTVKNEGALKTSFFIENLEDAKFRDQAIFRFEVIRPILELNKKKRRASVLARVNEVNSWSDNPKMARDNLNGCIYYHKISYTNVYKWIREYTEANGDIRSLLSSYHNSGGKNKTRLDPRVINIINERIEEIYNERQRVSIHELWYDIINKIDEENQSSLISLSIPSYPTIARYVSKIPSYDSVSKRIGQQTANNKFGGIGNGVEAYYPLERVELDHTPVDILLVDEKANTLKRPYLILGIDKFTRQVLGFSIGIGNSVGWPEVALCIKHIITDKSYVKEIYPSIKNDWNAFGLPKTIVVDNGLEFKNDPMKDAAYQIGSVLMFAPPKTPQWKGSIERFFGTLNTGLVHNAPGTTRSNPKELGDDENPSKLACLTFSTFIEIVHKWIIDVYSQAINKGAGGKPSDLWESAIENHPVSWPNSISETAILLGRTANRKVTRRGIELNGETYNNSELNKLLQQFSTENRGIQEDFKIKYDPMDIGEIYVYDKLINKRWIKVECTNYKYAKHLSEWEHKELRAYAKRKFGTVDIESLAKSKFELRQMFESSKVNKKAEMIRNKKINSGNEIKRMLSEKAADNEVLLNLAHNKIPNNSISHIGTKIEGTDDALIPEAFSNESIITNDIKIIDIDTIKSTNVHKKRITNCSKTSDTELNIDSFEGFGYIAGFFGEHHNE